MQGSTVGIYGANCPQWVVAMQVIIGNPSEKKKSLISFDQDKQ
jgi:hypothetical protein